MRLTCGPDPVVAHALYAKASGSLDLHGAVQFKDTLEPRITGDVTSLLVDMSAVDLLTSAGVGALIAVLRPVEAAGGRIALFGCNKKVLRVLQICELETVFNVLESADEARDALA